MSYVKKDSLMTLGLVRAYYVPIRDEKVLKLVC